MALLKTIQIAAPTATRGSWNPLAIRFEGARSCFLLRWFVILQGILGVFLVTAAEPFIPTEYQLKAAQIYGIAKFVEWPESAFAGPNSPVVFAVLGKDPFGPDLEAILKNKTLNRRKIIFKRFSRIKDLASCHILFISISEENRLADILETIEGNHTLTVGDMPRFPERGGILYFTKEALNVGFEINRSAATRASLKMRAQLLKLANRIHTDPPK